MEKHKTPTSSVFGRLRGDKQPKPLIFTRIKAGGKSSSSLSTKDRDFVFSYLGEVNEVQSSIPLRMKCIFTLDVMTDDSLKVKRRILAIIGIKASSNSKGNIKEGE